MEQPRPPRFRLVPFAELTARELHDLLRLRSLVFVVEQACVFLEIDGRDPEALHLLCEAPVAEGGSTLLGCARLFLPAGPGQEAVIGRIVTAPEARGTGLGKAIMSESLRALASLAPGAPVRLEAQAYLERFYGSFGFVRRGEGYLEDGIPHLTMVRPAC